MDTTPGYCAPEETDCEPVTVPDPTTPGTGEGDASVDPDDDPISAGGEAPSLPPVTDGPLLLATPFDDPVCGRWNQPDAGCEFGIEGLNVTGDFGCRTGNSCLRQDRYDQTDRPHVGVIREVNLPDGQAFIGAAFRVDEIPETGKGPIELLQMSPTDGTRYIKPVEVRLFRSGHLGLALYQGTQVALTESTIPVGEWFYVVVEIAYGAPAPQRMWVYGPDDEFVESVEIPLATAITFGKSRARQKVGGVTPAARPGTYTYADDWYISEEFQGPLHVTESVGLPPI